MLRLVSDENFNATIIRGLFRRLAEIDVVSVEGAGRRGMDDPDLLEWAAARGRIMLTHDTNTMVGFAYDRVGKGRAMPGVFVVPADIPIGRAIDELLILVQCSSEDEWKDRVQFIPL